MKASSRQGLIFNIQKFSLHDGSGIRTTVFFKGCPLNCKWCSNPESQLGCPEIITNDAKCIKCGKCVEICKLGAIEFVDNLRRIDREKCNLCMECAKVCPSGAIERNIDTRAITVNHDRCIGCKMCMDACRFGAILYDPNKRQVIKCELCGGDPQCVRFCPTGALQFLPKRLAHLSKRDRLAKRMTQSGVKVSGL